MPVYTYRAIDVDATPLTGEVAADTPRQARDELRRRGLTIERIDARREKRGWELLRRRRAKRAAPRVAAIVRDLATLLGAGIPLIEALATLARQHRGRFKAMLLAVREDVSAGASLADAMARRDDFFDELCVAITRVGESTGTLAEALSRLADFKEHTGRLRSRVGAALLYPAVVCTLGVAVTLFLMTFVVPNLLHALTQAGRELPTVTRIVQAVSDFLIHQGWVLAVGLLAVAVGVHLLLRTNAGQRAWHRLLLRIPLVGDLVLKESVSRLAVVLAALLRSGVVFVEAVRITRATMRNAALAEALQRCEAAVAAGADIAAPLERAKVFPPMVVQMLAVGQQAGELEQMLEQLAAAYSQHVETATARLTAVLEPLLIVILAVVVGFVAFATILPILEASNVLL